jgi:ABC-type multidrug transport system ATPase subunit
MPILTPEASSAEAIEVRDLVKAYQGDTRAVDGISLTVRQGEIVGFLGPNGSGKTTVTKIPVTLLTPAAGTARVTGNTGNKIPQDVRTIIALAAAAVIAIPATLLAFRKV